MEAARPGHIVVVHFGLEGSLGAAVEHRVVFVYMQVGAGEVRRVERRGYLQKMGLAVFARRYVAAHWYLKVEAMRL